MRLPTLTAALIALFVVTGCGPTDDQNITELNDGERTRFCRDLAKKDDCTLEYAGYPTTLETPDSEQCPSWNPDYGDKCDATVGETLDCFDKCTQSACEPYVPCRDNN